MPAPAAIPAWSNATTNDDSAPLLSLADAAASGDLNTVQTLLQAGHRVDQSFTDMGFTALHNASAQGQIDIIRLLIKNGASIDAQDANGATPLIYAAFHGQAQTVALLLNASANPNLLPKLGLHALPAAVAAGDAETVRLLIEHGADANLAGDSPDSSPSANDLAKLKNRADLLALMRENRPTR